MSKFPTTPWENLTAAQKQRSKPLLKHMALRIHDARWDKTGQVSHFFASELKLLAAKLHMSLYVSPEEGWPKMQAVAWAFYVLQLRATRRAQESWLQPPGLPQPRLLPPPRPPPPPRPSAWLRRPPPRPAPRQSARPRRSTPVWPSNDDAGAASQAAKAREADLKTAKAAAVTSVTRSAALNPIGSKKRAHAQLVRNNPAALVCSYCGATGFLNKQALGGHVSNCPHVAAARRPQQRRLPKLRVL